MARIKEKNRIDRIGKDKKERIFFSYPAYPVIFVLSSWLSCFVALILSILLVSSCLSCYFIKDLYG